MLVENNPFTPSFGRTPPFMAGRTILMNDLAKAFRGNGNDPYLQTLLMGARGTGKTALLTKACEIAVSEGWLAVSSTCVQGMLEDIAEQTLAASASLIGSDQRSRLKGVSVGQLLGLEWEHPDAPSVNWRTRMTSLLDKIADYGTGLLITVDEVRINIAELEQLVSVYQHFVREGRRVSLLMAGLPHQISQLINSDAVSFLRRSTTLTLGRIDDHDIGSAFVRTVENAGKSIGPEALAQCVEAIGGFPYMMQLVGFRSWDASEEELEISPDHVSRGILTAKKDLVRQILVPTWASLSNGDKTFCRMVAQGNRDAKSIGKAMGKKPNYVSKYKQRLLEQGVIEQDPYARLNFCLPGFEEFVRSATE